MTHLTLALFILFSVQNLSSSPARAQESETGDLIPRMCNQTLAGTDYISQDQLRTLKSSTGRTPRNAGETVEYRAEDVLLDFTVIATGIPDYPLDNAESSQARRGQWLAICVTLTSKLSEWQALDLTKPLLRLGALDTEELLLPWGACAWSPPLGDYPGGIGCTYEGKGMSPRIGLTAGEATTVALIFDVAELPQHAFLRLTGLSETGTKRIHDIALGDFAGTVGDQAGSEEQPEGLFSEIPYSDAVRVTQFGEEQIITIFPDKWIISFESVEVRTFIGDQSIVPQRGQFLVIWFYQSAQGTEPMPMGNFTLQGRDPLTGETNTYSISREGTAALIVTEYTWNPGVMSSGTPYRTGLVFDIRPEDTQFRLTLPLPSDVPFQDQIDLRFEA